MRVGLQIEEMLLARLGIPNIFVSPVGNVVVAMIVSITACVFSMQEFPDTIGVALHYGQEAFACAGFGNVDTCSIQDGRHDVLNANGAFASNFLRIPPFLWGAHEKRNSG